LPLRTGPLAAAAALFVVLSLTSPQIDSGIPPGALRGLVKAGELLLFTWALGALGLIRPRDWRHALATAN